MNPIPNQELGVMIQIPQHSKGGNLNDLNQILTVVDKHLSVDSWMIEVEECLKSNANGVESLSFPVQTLQTNELKALYSDVYQTIDGMFTGFVDSTEVINLIAIDSTCWEVSSTDPALLDDLSEQFGIFPNDA